MSIDIVTGSKSSNYSNTLL